MSNMAQLSVGGMLFGHWFPPHALCSVLPSSGRGVGLATPPHSIVLFERFRTISICYHFLHVTHISLFNITISNILLDEGTTVYSLSKAKLSLSRRVCCRMIRVSCRWGILPITWDAGLDVSAALGGDCIYIS